MVAAAGLGSTNAVGAAAPQLSQNLLLGRISLPHAGQFGATRAPQPPQNLACFRFSKPHTAHRILHFPRQTCVGTSNPADTR